MKPITKISLMLIDDNEIDNFVHHKVIELTECSQEIAVYNSANTALQHLNTNDLANIPDLILLDLDMPIMDGFSFLKEFENLSENVKAKSRIIILSSSGSLKDIEKAYANKYVIDYIPKPLTTEILLKSIKKRAATIHPQL